MRPMTKLIRFALAATVMAASAPAAAADYYLKLGPVKSASVGGKVREAAARAADKQVEVMSWSWGASQHFVAGDVDGDGRVDAFVPAGDVDGDGRADRAIAAPGAVASGTALRKRAHQPVGRGSVTLVGKFAACTVGAAYVDAVLQVAGARYTLEDVTITSCAATPGSSGGEPTLSLSASYLKRKLN